MTSQGTGPSPEALALSASSWASQIATWIPEDFGVSAPTAGPSRSAAAPLSSNENDFAAILASAGNQDDRLGLGHPLENKPKGRKPPGREGLSELEKRLERMNAKVKAQSSAKRAEEAEAVSRPSRGSDSDEEEESRASSLGKRKKTGGLDLLAGKKSKKAAKPVTPVPPAVASANLSQTPELQRAGSPAGNIAEPNRVPAPAPSAAGDATDDALAKMSKNQRKKLRKKLRQAEASETTSG